MRSRVLVTAFPQRACPVHLSPSSHPVFIGWVRRAAWPEGHLWGPRLPREEDKVSLCRDALDGQGRTWSL